ncbi:MAG: methylenetetrahydrofolate reductase [Cyanobacteria bacterium P01_F01_bin.33]
MSKLEAAARRDEFLITAEVAPPKGSDPSHMLEIVDKLKGRVHAINVTDSNRAVARMSPLVAAALIQQAGVEPVMQLACRDRNRIALQGDLLGASALGIRNVLALTGDPAKHGDCPDTRQVFEFKSIQLLHLIRCLNRGLDCNENPLPHGATCLFPGAAADPQHPDRSSQKRRCDRKVSQGAEFFQTQLITDFDLLEQFMVEIARPLQKPVLAGIFLLKSAKNARFINKYLPGVQIPEMIINRLEQASEPLQEGIAIAAEQIQQARHICQGVHVMAVKAEHLVVNILDLAEILPLQ